MTQTVKISVAMTKWMKSESKGRESLEIKAISFHSVASSPALHLRSLVACEASLHLSYTPSIFGYLRKAQDGFLLFKAMFP